jgi:hypothetical protein
MRKWFAARIAASIATAITTTIRAAKITNTIDNRGPDSRSDPGVLGQIDHVGIRARPITRRGGATWGEAL